MKLYHLAVLTVSAGLISGCDCTCEAESIVIDSNTGTALEAVNIYLLEANSSALTDSMGHFEISNFQNGMKPKCCAEKVRISKSGFTPKELTFDEINNLDSISLTPN